MWPQIILHADMDAFFAAVEQRDRPELKGRPVLIGSTSRRGVVTTASYEARPFGVGSAMSMMKARELCPHAVVVRPRMARYSEISHQVMDIFRDFSPRVEPLSVDEAFLDMTGAEGLFGSPREMGAALKRAVLEQTGLVVSVGAATTKYVAKVASDLEKPDGLVVVPPEEVEAFLHPLPVRRLWGVGPKGEERLHKLGLMTIGDVARLEPSLAASMGSLGAHLFALANGRDPRAVVTNRASKSVGSERTLGEDISGEAAVRPHLLRAADDVAQRLRKHGYRAAGIRVKLKTAQFELHTRQRRLVEPTDVAKSLYEAALTLLPEFDLSRRFRLVGLAAFDLVEEELRQFELFKAGVQSDEHRRRLDTALDAVHDRFGGLSLRRASELDPER